MPVKISDCLVMASRPSWERDGRKPNINVLCYTLLGSSTYNVDGKIVGVTYPSLTRRLEIYREGIEIVSVTREKSDLFSLAVYRRYITRRIGLPLDEMLFNLAIDLRFSFDEWLQLEVRMPDKSWIRGACANRARFGRKLHAAE